MNVLTLDQAMRIPASELAQRSAQELYTLKLDADAGIHSAEHCAEHVNLALDMRYGAHAQALRRARGIETGVVHFDDGNVRVTAELDKDVVWDQSMLAEIAARLSRQGEDPFQTIDASYSIHDDRYRTWTAEQQATYVAARYVQTKPPSYRLALLNEGEEL